MADNEFDIIIIGSGPGGYVTAIRAAQLGLTTAIVERDYLGGICLNWGCIPTKALLRSAEILHYLQHAKDYGLSAGQVTYDPGAVVKRSRAVSKRLNDGVGFLMKKNKVAVIWGEATIDAPGKVTVKQSRSEAPKGALGPATYTTKHIILATGARPRVLPGLEPDKKLVWTYFEAMVPDRIPKSILVVGSGAIGVEFASFYRTLGADVTLVEVLPQILPVEDAEIAAFARKSFEKQGIKIFTDAKVTKLDKKSESVVDRSRDGFALLVELRHFGVGEDLDALFFEALAREGGDFGVFDRQNLRQYLDKGHVRAKRAIERSEFNADRARTNDQNRFRDTVRHHGFEIGPDKFLVGFKARQDPRPRARCEDDVLGCVGCRPECTLGRLASALLHCHFARRINRCFAPDDGDLVLLH